ncbi:MAG: ABC transporter permease [Streptococcaceae bacterium]|jgi:putative ABC transport system permease protein|nr:ABC transporter permease [Streptococcaceae bacterium]
MDIGQIILSLPDIFISSVSQGLLWALLSIGVFITFRILDIADLTTEGTFPFGGAISAVAIVSGFSPFLSVLFAFVGGSLAGLVSGLLHTKLKIPALLAGIITMTGLYSITSRVMSNSPQVNLLGQKLFFSFLLKLGIEKVYAVIIGGILFTVIVTFLLIVFFKTEIGLAMRAVGDNLEMSAANGVNTDRMKIVGYMLSNGCIALSGALVAQNVGFSDLNSGVGTIVVGLASVIIAEVLFPNKPLAFRLFTVALGSIIYRFLLSIILEFPIQAQDVKLFSALILIICLTTPLIKEKLNSKA